MADKCRTDYLTICVVAFLASGVTSSIIFVLVQVQLSELEARHTEELTKVKSALEELRQHGDRGYKVQRHTSAFSQTRVPESASLRRRRNNRHGTETQAAGQNRRLSCREAIMEVQDQINSIMDRTRDDFDRQSIYQRVRELERDVRIKHTVHFQLTADKSNSNEGPNHIVLWKTPDRADPKTDYNYPTFQLIKIRTMQFWDRVKVVRDGYYQLYAQVIFRGKRSQDSDPNTPYNTFYIQRDRHGQVTTLTTGVTTQTKLDSGHQPWDTVFTMGIFLLNKNDTVYVQIKYDVTVTEIDFGENIRFGGIFIHE